MTFRRGFTVRPGQVDNCMAYTGIHHTLIVPSVHGRLVIVYILSRYVVVLPLFNLTLLLSYL